LVARHRRGLLALIVATLYKPEEMMGYCRREQAATTSSGLIITSPADAKWGNLAAVSALFLDLLFMLRHIIAGGISHH
jgi:hypothetical protein